MDVSVCSYRASYLKDTLTLLKLVCETSQDTFFGARNNVHRAFKTIKRKSSVLADICLPDLCALAGSLVFGTCECSLEARSQRS